MACDHYSWHLATNAIGPPPPLVFRMAKCLPDDSKSRGLNLRRLSPLPLLPRTSSPYSSYLMSRGGFCGSRACVLSELELAKLFSSWLRVIPQHQAKRSHFKSPKSRFHFSLPRRCFRSHRRRRSTTVALNQSQRYYQHITTVSIVWFV